MLEQLTLASFLDSLRRRWYLPIAFLLVGTAVSMAITTRLPKIYRASTLILVEPQKIPVAYVRPTVTTSIENRLRSIQQQITSRSSVERVIRELNLFPDRMDTVPMENLVGSVASKIQLDVRGTSTFRIYYEGVDPNQVAAVANKIADLFIAENTEAREREARTTTEFLEAELAKVKTSLDEEESAIAMFKREHMGELPEQRDSNMRTVEGLQTRLRTNAEAQARAKDRRLTLESQLATLPSTGTSVNQMAIQLEQGRDNLRQLLTRFTEQHPEVAQQRREIARLEQLLAESPAVDPNSTAPSSTATVYETRLRADIEAIEQELRTLAAESDQIRRDMAIYQQRVDNAPKNEATLNALMRDYDNLRSNYQSLLNKKVEANLAENLERERQGEQFNILDRAVPPVAPYKPNLTQIVLLGSVFGALAGCCVAFAADLMRPRFRTEEELAAAYGIPVLATVPKITTDLDRRRERNRKLILVGSGVAVAVLGLIFIALVVIG